MGKNLEQVYSQRVHQVLSTFSKQTSVPTPGAITMSGGTPDFDTPQHIVDAACKALNEGQTKYTPWPGIPQLREALAEKLQRVNHLTYNPNGEILVTAGAQGAMMSTILALVDPGDEVVIPTPFFDEYRRDVMIAGGMLVAVPTHESNDFAVTPEDIERVITSKTKLLILVSPSNPTAAVIGREALARIAELAIKHDLMVISDELYEGYLYDDTEHVSIATMPGMWERTVVISGFSKTYGMTGFRVGYLAAPEAIVKAALPINHGMIICAPAAFQYAALAAVTGPMDWFKEVLAEYDKRRRMWMAALDEMGLTYGRPKGAYYIMFNVTSTGLTSSQFAQKMREDAGVIVGSGGGPTDEKNEGYNRGSFAVATEQLEAGFARMIPAVRKLKGM